ncbi:MAG: hypothetical protein LBP29_10500 [Treponema sp.]|jgi:hypothetical protein|nr:hypothetical protein [Treponema sp.]
MDCSRLHLFSPILYREIALVPSRRDSSFWEIPGLFTGEFFGLPDNPLSPEPFPEMLFHFRINRSGAFAMEADGKDYLEFLVAAGRADANGGLELPAGEYFFTQAREKLDTKAFIELAMELQKEGLWERVRLGETVYFRILWEDGAQVSQVLRPLRKTPGVAESS